MTPGIFARTYVSKDADAIFAQARSDGFAELQFNLSCVGLPTTPERVPGGVGEKTANSARAAGVRIIALSGTYNMIHPDPERRAAGRRGLTAVLHAAREMGAPIVTLCTGSRDPTDMWRAHPDNASPEAWAELRRELEPAVETAERLDIKLGVEPEPGNVVRDAPAARRLLDEIKSRRLGIVLDAANLLAPASLLRQRAVIAEATALLGDAVVLCHAKDMAGDGKVVAAGKGVVDLAFLVAQVKAAGFDGALVGHGFTASEAPAVAAHLKDLIEGRK
jgi:sugar phosphate isomerase/epimerase